MSKKGKKYENTEAETPQVAETPQPDTGEVSQTESTSPIKEARPQVFLRHEGTGLELQLVRRPNMPKKSAKSPAGDIQVILDGQEIPAWVTSSKGWSAEDKVLEYIWIQPSAEVSGFLTLDYMQPASDYAGTEFTLQSGKANRADPTRVPRDEAKDKARIAAFQAKMAERKAAAPAETPADTAQA